VPVAKVLCGARETTISRDWWLVVVTVTKDDLRPLPKPIFHVVKDFY
jgi:hypothetical protein